MKYVQTGKNAILGAAAAVMIAGGLSMAMAQEIPIPSAAAPFVPFGDRGQVSQTDDNHGEADSEDRPTFVVRLRAATEPTPTEQPAAPVRADGPGQAAGQRSASAVHRHPGTHTPSVEPVQDDVVEEDAEDADEGGVTPTPKPQVNPAIGRIPTDFAPAPQTPKTPGPSFSASDALAVVTTVPAVGPELPTEDPGGDDGEGGGVKPLGPKDIGMTTQQATPVQVLDRAPLALITPTPEPSRTIIGGFQKLTKLEDSAAPKTIVSR